MQCTCGVPRSLNAGSSRQKWVQLAAPATVRHGLASSHLQDLVQDCVGRLPVEQAA